MLVALDHSRLQPQAIPDIPDSRKYPRQAEIEEQRLSIGQMQKCTQTALSFTILIQTQKHFSLV
jgi:hypothetical protein